MKNKREYPLQICCICGKKFRGWGNNPWPIKQDGVCCDNCNWAVIEERLIQSVFKRSSNND